MLLRRLNMIQKLKNINDKPVLKNHKDEKTLELINEEYYPKIHNFIFKHVRSVTEAEDLTQDVFVELSKDDRYFNSSKDIEKYIYGMSRNIIRKHFRNKNKTIKIIYIDSNTDFDSDENIRTYIDPSHKTKIDKTEIEEIKVIIKQALSKVPPKACHAITLKYIDGLSSEEAAEKIGCSVNTFYQRLHHGKKILLKHLKKKFSHMIKRKKIHP